MSADMGRAARATGMVVSVLLGLSVVAEAQDAPLEPPAVAELSPAVEVPAEPAPAPAPVAVADSPAPPDSPAVIEARERLSRGERLFEAGDFAAARVEFVRSYALLEGHPQRHRVLYNIAQTQQWEYDYVAAIATYRRYLDEGGAAERAQVEATIALLTSLLAYVDVRVSPATAELWVDGRKQGAGSMRLPVPAGRHLLEAQADGYQGARRDLSLAPGESSAVTLALAPMNRRFEGLHPGYFWATSAVSGGLLIAGGTFGLLTLGRRQELDRRLADPTERWQVTEAERDGLTRNARTADALLLTGTVVAAGALVLGLLTRWEHP